MAIKEFIQDSTGNVTVEKDTGEVTSFNLSNALTLSSTGLLSGGAALDAGQAEQVLRAQPHPRPSSHETHNCTKHAV